MAHPPNPPSDTAPAPSNSRHLDASVQKPAGDRRVRRTQRQLRDSLVTLILERGWDAVTVRDVCAHADVGRSTFYLHYADKESLLLSGFDELHAEMTAVHDDCAGPFQFAHPLMAHALEHERLFRALVGRQSGHQMQWQFREVVVTVLTEELAAMGMPPAARAETARFLAGGFLELLTALLDAARPPDGGVGAPVRPDPALTLSHAETFRRLALAVVQAA